MKLLTVLLALQAAPQAVADRVEIVRTEYGVPHIFADDLEAMGYGLAWVQSEDYGSVVAIGFEQMRGTYARHVGPDSIAGDFVARQIHARATETFHRLDPRTRAVYAGFAQGVNAYIRRYPEQFPDWITPNFTGIDAHARDVQTWSRGDAARFVRNLQARGGGPAPPEAPDDEGSIGSNAWALDGTRTTSGRAILLRNPHLSWQAGYYEAHVRVPGVLEFYGDFRIGGAFGIIGGFNRHLGWATTNNSPTYSQVYALEAHPDLAAHAVLDGAPLPLQERSTTVDYVEADGTVASETRTDWWTPFGPVIHRDRHWIYILKDPRDGEFRRGEQFLRMMMATELDQWLQIMRMRAHPSSNFTYADAAGNIVHYYNARIPSLPHEVTGDTAAIARGAEDMWSELVDWDDLPLYVNPPGGYVQQANDTPDYSNLNVPLDRDTVAPNLPEPRLRLRSQLSLDLIHGEERLSLEDVVELKHSPRMLLAERVLDELLDAVRDFGAERELADAVRVLGAWDRTASVDSRGGFLFDRWARRYFSLPDSVRYRIPWDPARPTTTPTGIGRPNVAVGALYAAVGELRAARVPLDSPWGEHFRVIRGEVDVPVSGCPGGFGCFRTLSFAPVDETRLAASSGDGWVFAVEFGEIPRAYSVLSYGQSPDEASPHHADQAAMFARGEMKPVAWTDEDVDRRAVRRYRPGR